MSDPSPVRPPDPDQPQPRWTVIREDGLAHPEAGIFYAFPPVGEEEFAALVADVRTARRAEAEDWETKARQWDELQAAKAALDEWAGGDDA